MCECFEQREAATISNQNVSLGLQRLHFFCLVRGRIALGEELEVEKFCS